MTGLLNNTLIIFILLFLFLNLSYLYSKSSFTISTTSIESLSKWRNEHLIPPFIPLRSTFVISPKYGLAACRIQKNLSTILLNLFCFLNNPIKFSRSAASSLTTEFKNHLSIETCNSSHATHIATNNNYKTKLAIIRDPVERFLSGFVDKCIHEAEHKSERCYGCKGNVMCVVEKQYNRFQLIMEGKLTEFSYEDRHFAPMSWFCDFDAETIKNYRFLYFGETEAEQEHTVLKLIEILDEHGVKKQTTAFALEKLMSNRTKHSTSGSAIRRKIGEEVRNNASVMYKLYQIYGNDYKVFKLQSPFRQFQIL